MSIFLSILVNPVINICIGTAVDLWGQSLLLIFGVDTKIGFERPVQGTLGKPIDFNVFAIWDFSIESMDRAVTEAM